MGETLHLVLFGFDAVFAAQVNEIWRCGYAWHDFLASLRRVTAESGADAKCTKWP
jgi:hypothetical protein